MNIAFTFKNFEPSDHLKEYAENRFGKLSKYIANMENVDIQVNLSVEKFRQIAEVVLSADDIYLSAYEETEDMYSTIDLILDKIVAQVKKIRDKKASRGRRNVRMDTLRFSFTDEGESERTIVATDHYEPKPMSVEEAAEQLDSLRYDFLVFRNAEIERVNVIYRRKNGDFGLIDPGM